MAILAFQKPEKVIMLEADEKYGKFEFRPLEPGYGITIGNPLRRILLSSLEGYAINTIRIAGVGHHPPAGRPGCEGHVRTDDRRPGRRPHPGPRPVPVSAAEGNGLGHRGGVHFQPGAG